VDWCVGAEAEAVSVANEEAGVDGICGPDPASSVVGTQNQKENE
jgi:hypothetical protein